MKPISPNVMKYKLNNEADDSGQGITAALDETHGAKCIQWFLWA